jgi:hypothetical protein
MRREYFQDLSLTGQPRDPLSCHLMLTAGERADEWVNTPISRGSATELRSGMAFQVDVIPGDWDAVLHDEHRGRDRRGR